MEINDHHPAFFLSINFIFSAIYMLIGLQQLGELMIGSNWKIFREIFYFSTQTITTAGYGHVYPVGDAADSVAALEELKVFFRLQLELV